MYENRSTPPRPVVPANESVTCFVSDRRSERIASTLPNSEWRRELSGLTAPVVGSMESAGTHTGRFASSGSANAAVRMRFRSRNPYWLTPRA